MGTLLNHLMTRRTALAGMAGAGASLAVSACSKKTDGITVEPIKLAIIHTNDTHGHDLLDEESLGLAAAAQLRNDYEAKGYEVLMLDAGDAVQGDNLVQHSKGMDAIDFFNELRCDAMALGNHEFDFGQDCIEDYVNAANFPLLSANTIVDATGETFVEPRTTLTLSDGTMVGVFGLTTPETSTDASPLMVRGLTFLEGDDLYACAQKQVDALRAEGCSLIVCLGHLGEDDEIEPSRACDVIAHVSGIDLFIDGHDHAEEAAVLDDAAGGSTLVVETGCYTHAIGVVTWEDGVLSNVLEPFGSYEGQDGDLAAYIQEVHDRVYGELDSTVATTAFDLDGERESVRTKETNLGDLVADAYLWEAQQMADDTPDFALVNGGSLREPIASGEIKRSDVINVVPFINYLCTVKISGAKLLEAFEASCASLPDDTAAFPQVSGLTYSVDTRVPFESAGTYPGTTHQKPANPGARVTIHTVGERAFSPDEVYTLASSDFVCAGGDTYYAIAEAAVKTMRSINYLTYDCFEYYLEEACNGEVPEQYAQPQGRVTLR